MHESNHPRTWRQIRRAGLLASLLTAAILVSACSAGGAGKSNLGQAPQSPATDQQPSPLAFSACMRTNGVPNFPDPSGDGNFILTRGPNGTRLLNGVAIDFDSPQYQSAQAKCSSLLPSSTSGPGQRSEEAMQAALKFAACMRENGVPNFPDPSPDGRVRVGMGTPGPDPSSPVFQKALQSCQALLDGLQGGAQMRGGTGR